MFTSEERNRLENRDSEEMNAQTRASNDARVRRKIAKWLRDFDDISLAIANLPKNQLRKIFKDEDAYKLLDLAFSILDIRDFKTIVGDVTEPQFWKVVNRKMFGTWNLLREEPEGEPATDLDIRRSAMLNIALTKLKEFYEGPKDRNPVGGAAFLLELMASNPEHVSEAEKWGAERLREAIKATKKE